MEEKYGIKTNSLQWQLVKIMHKYMPKMLDNKYVAKILYFHF